MEILLTFFAPSFSPHHLSSFLSYSLPLSLGGQSAAVGGGESWCSGTSRRGGIPRGLATGEDPKRPGWYCSVTTSYSQWRAQPDHTAWIMTPHNMEQRHSHITSLSHINTPEGANVCRKSNKEPTWTADLSRRWICGKYFSQYVMGHWEVGAWGIQWGKPLTHMFLYTRTLSSSSKELFTLSFS